MLNYRIITFTLLPPTFTTAISPLGIEVLIRASPFFTVAVPSDNPSMVYTFTSCPSASHFTEMFPPLAEISTGMLSCTAFAEVEAEHLSYEWVKKHYNHEFLFITDYSAEKRAFYHMRDENGVPQGYDLIWRGVEITTGAQREHRYEVLKKQAEEKGLANDVKFYLEFFKYGCPPHGGFGIGVDRLTMLLLGLPIKEAMFLFRGPARLTP